MRIQDVEWVCTSCSGHLSAIDISTGPNSMVHIEFNGETYTVIEMANGIVDATKANSGMHGSLTAEEVNAFLVGID